MSSLAADMKSTFADGGELYRSLSSHVASTLISGVGFFDARAGVCISPRRTRSVEGLPVDCRNPQNLKCLPALILRPRFVTPN
jgi:hypothetical protein